MRLSRPQLLRKSIFRSVERKTWQDVNGNSAKNGKVLRPTTRNKEVKNTSEMEKYEEEEDLPQVAEKARKPRRRVESLEHVRTRASRVLERKRYSLFVLLTFLSPPSSITATQQRISKSDLLLSLWISLCTKIVIVEIATECLSHPNCVIYPTTILCPAQVGNYSYSRFIS